MSEPKSVENPQDRDMMSMFASVWVKVEVNDEDGGIEYDNPLTQSNISTCTKNQKPSRKDKTLKCGECDYTTIYRNCLKIHMQGHTNTKPLSCDVCDYTTRYPTSLSRHILIQHEFKNMEKEGLYTFKCEDCNYTTYFKWNLKAHRRKHKLEKQFKCDICAYETAYRHNYIKHGKVHNKQEVLYKCDKCPFVTKFEGHISRHLAKIHNEISDKASKCDFCDFSTKNKWRLNIHIQRSKQTDVLKCMYCKFETVFMCESKKHKVIHSNEVCTKNIAEQPADKITDIDDPAPADNTTDISNQSPHEKSNHYVLDPKCEQEWNSIQVIETPNTDRPFQCIKCNYTSRFKASVQRHYQRHHTDKQNRPYKCTNCGFSTKTKDQITLHGKRSQSDTILNCDVCQFTTYFKCQYVTHQRCHYPYKCTVCSYACKQKHDIEKHFQVTHTENGLKCRFCDYKVTRKENLISHEATHTGIKPFKCMVCDYTSLTKTLLDKHMKRRHGQVKYDTVVVSDSKIQSLKIIPEQNLGDQERNSLLKKNDQVESGGEWSSNGIKF